MARLCTQMISAGLIHLFLPAVFAADSLQCCQTSSSAAHVNRSFWCQEVSTGCTCLLASIIGESERNLVEKCLLNCSVSPTTEFHDLCGDTTLSRIKRSDPTNINGTICLNRFHSVRDILGDILYLLICVVGTFLSGTLAYIYWKYEELHTRRNALIINLAFSDVLFVLMFIAFQAVAMIYELDIRCLPKNLLGFYVFCVCVWASVVAYSIALISVQRYFYIIDFKTPVMKRFVKVYIGPKSLVTAVWVVSTLFAIPEAAHSRMVGEPFHSKNPKIFANEFYPLVLFGLIPGTVTVISYVAAQKRPLEERLGQEFVKDRPGTILVSLGVVFLTTYLPILLSDLWADVIHKDAHDIYYFVSNLLLCLGPILCPIALCVASGRIRRYFKRHLLRFCMSKEDLDELQRRNNSVFALREHENRVGLEHSHSGGGGSAPSGRTLNETPGEN